MCFDILNRLGVDHGCDGQTNWRTDRTALAITLPQRITTRAMVCRFTITCGCVYRRWSLFVRSNDIKGDPVVTGQPSYTRRHLRVHRRRVLLTPGRQGQQGVEKQRSTSPQRQRLLRQGRRLSSARPRRQLLGDPPGLRRRLPSRRLPP